MSVAEAFKAGSAFCIRTLGRREDTTSVKYELTLRIIKKPEADDQLAEQAFWSFTFLETSGWRVNRLIDALEKHRPELYMRIAAKLGVV